MKPCVVDASVAAAAFFDEPVSDAARKLLSSDRELLAPDLIRAEVANVIWKRVRRREISGDEAGELLADFLLLPLQIVSSHEIIAPALELAVQTGRTAYDCLYLALAVLKKIRLVTADERLVNSLADTPLKRHVAWVGRWRGA